MNSFQDKVVMITGASSGIGRGLAVELGRRGAKVGLVARRADVLEEVIREIEAVGSKAVAVPADVQDAGSMSAAAEKVRSELGPIDILIANAGIGPTRDAAEIDAAEIAGVINVNVIGGSNIVAAGISKMGGRRTGKLVVELGFGAYRGRP